MKMNEKTCLVDVIRGLAHPNFFRRPIRGLLVFKICILGTLFGGSQNATDPAVEGFKPGALWTYKTMGEVELKLHVFFPPRYKTSDKRPTLLLFYGGAWNGGSPSQFYPQCAYFASRGMIAIAAEYRVRERHGTSPRECVSDGKSALRWLRRHAAERGIDPNRIVAGGGSAGGHIAAALATVKGFDDPGDDVDVSCRPDALILFNPVFDNGPGGYGYDRVKDYWQQISPLHNIGDFMPPTIVLLGDQDKLVPVATARKFQEMVQAKGGKCEVRIFPGSGHGFFNYKNRENYRQTLVEAEEFLHTNGLLPRPDES